MPEIIFPGKIISLFFTFFGSGLPLSILTAFGYYKYTWKSFIIIILFFIIISLFFGITDDLFLYIFPLILGLIAGYCIKTKKSITIFIVLSSIILTVSASGLFYYSLYYEKSFNNKEIITFDHEKAAGQHTDAEIEQLKQKIASYNNIIIHFFPSIIFFVSIILGGVAVVIIKMLFLLFLDEKSTKGLEYYRLHDHVIIGLLINISLLLLFTYILFDNLYYLIIQVILANILLCTMMLFVVQAFGIIKYYIQLYRVPNYLIFLFALLVLFLQGIMVPLAILLSVVGILDMWADFRKIEINTKQK